MSSTSVLTFSKENEKAKTPTKGSENSAGFDLYSAVDITVEPRSQALISTGLVIETPKGTYGRIAPRSGLAINNFIGIGAGVIDGDYRGQVGVVIFNHGSSPFKIEEGDRIAQLICEKIEKPELKEVGLGELEATGRTTNGYGSTGK